ncbi:Protein NSTP-5 a [Aphelenchoides avenae]|nr:Protein NSTP-5 a [Aphelenchus avenae]
MTDEKLPAASKEPSKFEFGKMLKYVSLVVLVVQNASQVLLMRYATTRDQPPFLKTVAVFFNEVVKLVASLALFFATNGSMRKSLGELKHHFITNFLDTLKVGVPAFIYTIQNFLLYVAIENLDAGTYMVTYQMKILTTALFTVLMLKRRISLLQWLSLVVLCVGVAIVQISAKQGAKAVSPSNATVVAELFFNETTLAPTTPVAVSQAPAQNPIIGFSAIVVACFLSGFAGIYFEKILKGSSVSLWLRNVQLASLSLPIGLVVIGAKDWTHVAERGFMQGFDLVVWGVVLLQALGGLVVAVVIKYADNILKAFATSVAIVCASVASIFLFAVYPRLLFILGAALVIVAVVVYGSFPYRAKYQAAPTEPEQKDKPCDETTLELKKMRNEAEPNV